MIRPASHPLLLASGTLALALLGAGCASAPWESESADVAPAADFPRSRLVALDFVDAMVQLPELEPARTTLYIERPASRFGELLVGSLQSRGYDLRLGVDGAPTTLGYRVESGAGEVPSGTANGDSLYTFLVEAGTVRLRRSYRVDFDGVRPASPMQLHGANGLALTASASRFDTASAPAAVSTRALPRRVEPPPLPASPSQVPVRSADTARSAAPRKRNLFETGRSNYAERLARYEDVSREIMVFPNDSLRMGAANKRRAAELAVAFDPERDVISVLGCSHGRTAIDNGNEVLANGRALRVKEELVLAGIAGERVLEEGCWAGSAHERLPGRGVVVTHKRLAAG